MPLSDRSYIVSTIQVRGLAGTQFWATAEEAQQAVAERLADDRTRVVTIACVEKEPRA